jgi:hypothetical protein
MLACDPPLFAILRSKPNLCWCRKPDGTFAAFTQEEGFALGCPLSPFFARLVLNVLLTPAINADLCTQASTHPATCAHPCPGPRTARRQRGILLGRNRLLTMPPH